MDLYPPDEPDKVAETALRTRVTKSKFQLSGGASLPTETKQRAPAKSETKPSPVCQSAECRTDCGGFDDCVNFDGTSTVGSGGIFLSSAELIPWFEGNCPLLSENLRRSGLNRWNSAGSERMSYSAAFAKYDHSEFLLMNPV